MRIVTGFGRFWWDFVVGDDWRIAAGVVACLAAGAVLVSVIDASDEVVSIVVAIGIVGVVASSLARAARGARSSEDGAGTAAPMR